MGQRGRKKYRRAAYSDEELREVHRKNQARYFESRKLCDCPKSRKRVNGSVCKCLYL